jgi:hypothetical protein
LSFLPLAQALFLRHEAVRAPRHLWAFEALSACEACVLKRVTTATHFDG